MRWTDGPIDGVEKTSLSFHTDERGWLVECFRVDELPETNQPLMAYVSMTRSGITRGPHEHRHQSDLFVFFDGQFTVYLWDNRQDTDTHGHRQVLEVGRDHPTSLIVPPGVVHAYRNAGPNDALIINCPNELYAGWNRQEEVDEIRYEEQADHPFILE